jgi:hypothetical protein
MPTPTAVRAAVRHRHGRGYLSIVNALDTAEGHRAYFQLYEFADSGILTLVTESSYSTDAAAVDRWLRDNPNIPQKETTT